MIYDKDICTLSTGRTFYANNGIVGLDPECGSNGMISEGYDGAFDVEGRNTYPDDNDEERRQHSAWTPKERAELADEMIRRWTVFKESGVTRG